MNNFPYFLYHEGWCLPVFLYCHLYDSILQKLSPIDFCIDAFGDVHMDRSDCYSDSGFMLSLKYTIIIYEIGSLILLVNIDLMLLFCPRYTLQFFISLTHLQIMTGRMTKYRFWKHYSGKNKDGTMIELCAKLGMKWRTWSNNTLSHLILKVSLNSNILTKTIHLGKDQTMRIESYYLPPIDYI